VENLILQGNADLQGYGNGLSNALYGNSGNNPDGFRSSNPTTPAILLFADVRALPSSYASSLRSRQKYSCIIHKYSSTTVCSRKN
jgi:hypothetical protein